MIYTLGGSTPPIWVALACPIETEIIGPKNYSTLWIVPSHVKLTVCLDLIIHQFHQSGTNYLNWTAVYICDISTQMALVEVNYNTTATSKVLNVFQDASTNAVADRAISALESVFWYSQRLESNSIMDSLVALQTDYGWNSLDPKLIVRCFI